MAKAPEAEPEEEGEEECPKCPPVGAPAWMATFADMATLLMAFFVLILSFAEMNVPKFKQISGSLKNSFGVQQVIPVVEQPKGTTLLDLKFSPSPSPSVTEEMTQKTTAEEQPELKIPSDNDDSQGDNNMQEGAQPNEGLGGETFEGGAGEEGAKQGGLGDTGEARGGESSGETRSDAERLAEALEQIGAAANIEAEIVDGRVVVNLNAEDASPREMMEKFKRVGQAVEIAGLATGKADEEILFGGLDQQLNNLIAFVSEIERQSEAVSGGAQQEADDTNEFAGGADAEAEARAKEAADELRVKMAQEIAQGLVEVEQRDGKVYVTVGTGGAFPSGSAVLTEQARGIIARIAEVSDGAANEITVAGHTDTVPIAFGALYRDNWDLAAARAASVVQEIERSGLVGADRLQAVSYGETRPVADNGTADGRERNRRIEIELDY